MGKDTRKDDFLNKYRHVGKIWSGKDFMAYQDLKTLLAELPISEVAEPSTHYKRQFWGNRDYVYGEILYAMTGYEGFLRDRASHLLECDIKPIFTSHGVTIQFNLQYQTKAGEKGTISSEVVRTGETSYIYYVDYFRPL